MVAVVSSLPLAFAMLRVRKEWESLAMTKSEVRKNIRQYENSADACRRNIRSLENKIHELERLRSKFQALQDSFGSRQTDRRQKLSNLFSTRLHVKMISAYTSAMNGLLTGSEYQNAYGGLSAAMERINAQIRRLQNESQMNNSNLNYSIRKMNYWKSRLKDAKD